MKETQLLYKLTDSNWKTLNDTKWGPNVTHKVENALPGEPLCTSSWIHVYESPLIAVLLNPVHGHFSTPCLWEAKGQIGLRNSQLKAGCREVTTIKQIPLPIFSTIQKIAFGILCGKAVCKNTQWNTWADNWINGKDRTEAAAKAAEAAAWAAAWATAKAAAWAAAWNSGAAAEAAAKAAEAAAWAAAGAAAKAAEAAAEAAAWAAEAAAKAAEAAAEAAAWAAEAAAETEEFNLIELAESALLIN